MSEINSVMVHHADELLQGLPKSVRVVYEVIKKAKNPIKISDLASITSLTDRTIRTALHYLYKLELVNKVPDLSDMRSHYLQLVMI